MDISLADIDAALADVAARQEAIAIRRKARQQTLHRERMEELADVAEMKKLRLLAVRLSAKAGIERVSEKTFYNRTKHQLVNTIHELRNYLNAKEA